MAFPDLINWVDGTVGQLAHGPMHRFTYSSATGFRGVDVEMLLRQYGVRVWGREVIGDEELALLVKQRQAIWAEYILCRAGVPLTSSLLDPRNEQYRLRHVPGAMPTPWTERGIGAHSFVDHVVDLLNRIIG